MANISEDARAVLNQAGEGAEDYVLQQGGFGGKLTSGEARKLLAGFKPVALGEAANALESSSVPDFSDPLKIRERLYRDLGVTDLRDEVTGVKDNLRKFDEDTRGLGQQIEGRQVSMSKITGIKDQAMRQRALGRIGIANELEAKADLLSAKLGEAQTQFGILMDERSKKEQMMLQAPGAGITYLDSFESATKKINNWNKKQEKEAREQAKEDALDTLFMQTFGYDRGGMSKKKARKMLKKRMGSDRAYEEEMRSLEMADLKSTTAKRDSGVGGGEKEIKMDYSDNGIASLIEQGINMGDDWGTLAATLEGAGINTSPNSFADKFLQYKFLGWDNPLE